MVKKLTPITAYLHEPLRAARSASDETDALIKTQGNQNVGTIQPIASIQPEEGLAEVIQQAVDEEAATMPIQIENTELIQEPHTRQREANELQESNTDNQNFRLMSEKVDQVQGIPDSDIDDPKHISIARDVGLWTELSHEEVSYWLERGPSRVQHSCGPFSNSKRMYITQSRFCTKALFYSTKSNGETYNREWLVYSPSKGRVFLLCL